jgi:two-component system response regulator MprA
VRKAFSWEVVLTTSARLLLADPDVRRADLLCKHLSAQGFHTTHTLDSQSLKAQLLSADSDLLLVWEPLAPLTAVDLCQQLRDHGSTLPILILTESQHYGVRVLSLQSGADDVLSAPYALEELVARLQALLRRARMGRNELAGGSLSYGDLIVDTDARQVTRAGQPVKLSVKEYDLLLCLLRHQQQILPRQRLLHLVWGDTWVGDDNLLDVYIRYLRKKIERPDLEPLIHTVRGVGFVLK